MELSGSVPPLCLCTQNSYLLTGTHLSPCRPPLLGLTITRRGWEPGRGLIWRRAINIAQTSIRQDWWDRQWDVGGWHTCSAWPSPRVNLKVWLASSGLVLGGDSPSPRFSIDWRSCKHKWCLHFFTHHKIKQNTIPEKKHKQNPFSSPCDTATLCTASCMCRGRLLS